MINNSESFNLVLKNIMNPMQESIRDVFFDAMIAGWASYAKEISIAELPGSKTIEFVKGHFRVLDCYFLVPNSNKSSGSTTIWYRNQPAWVMHYGGFCHESAIPFLKSCLLMAYDKGQFNGGRGPLFVLAPGNIMTYSNRIDCHDFSHFYGREKIWNGEGEELEYHWYHGMSLTGNIQLQEENHE